MKRKLIRMEIAALEERLHLNHQRMGVDSLGQLQRSPVIQRNLLPILGGSLVAGVAAGLISREVNSPFKKLLPFLIQL